MNILTAAALMFSSLEKLQALAGEAIISSSVGRPTSYDVLSQDTTTYCNPENSGYTLLKKGETYVGEGSKVYDVLNPGGCQDNAEAGWVISYAACEYLGDDLTVYLDSNDELQCSVEKGGTDVDVKSAADLEVYNWNNGYYGFSEACHYRGAPDCWWYWQIQLSNTTINCPGPASCSDGRSALTEFAIAGIVVGVACCLLVSAKSICDKCCWAEKASTHGAYGRRLFNASNSNMNTPILPENSGNPEHDENKGSFEI